MKDRRKLEIIAEELVESYWVAQKTDPGNWPQYYARLAFKNRQEYDGFLIEMEWHLKKENNITNTTTRLEESLETAKKLASRKSNPEPHSEYYARSVLFYQTYKWEQKFVVDSLGCMEIALELEKDRKDRKELETTAKELASRNSNPEPESERYARCALKIHKEYDKFLIYMAGHLKLKDRKGKDYDKYFIYMKRPLKWERYFE